MKKVLFAGLLVLAGVSVSAQNLIKNEKFATEVKTKVTNANKATVGEWFIRFCAITLTPARTKSPANNTFFILL